jgi:hypothetical protein
MIDVGVAIGDHNKLRIEDALETLAKEIKSSKNIRAAYNEVDLFINNVKKYSSQNCSIELS